MCEHTIKLNNVRASVRAYVCECVFVHLHLMLHTYQPSNRIILRINLWREKKVANCVSMEKESFSNEYGRFYTNEVQ